jgi:hypothetical protein
MPRPLNEIRTQIAMLEEEAAFLSSTEFPDATRRILAREIMRVNWDQSIENVAQQTNQNLTDVLTGKKIPQQEWLAHDPIPLPTGYTDVYKNDPEKLASLLGSGLNQLIDYWETHPQTTPNSNHASAVENMKRFQQEYCTLTENGYVFNLQANKNGIPVLVKNTPSLTASAEDIGVDSKSPGADIEAGRKIENEQYRR